jgi:hypothetical protein
LANDDGAGADDHDAVEVGAFRHGRPPKKDENVLAADGRRWTQMELAEPMDSLEF